MANGKIGVGATIGIVVAVTAAVGLGLYFILKPKKIIAATPSTGGSSINAAQVAALQAQLEKMQADAIASQNNISNQQKELNKQQLNSILLALGGKIASAGVDKLINSFGSGSKNSYLDTSLADTAPDYVTDSIWTDSKYGYLSPWG
jgi:hypothetical protein